MDFSNLFRKEKNLIFFYKNYDSFFESENHNKEKIKSSNDNEIIINEINNTNSNILEIEAGWDLIEATNLTPKPDILQR